MWEHMYVHIQKHEKSLALWERWTSWDPRQKSRWQKRTKTNQVSAKRPVECFPETQRHCKESALVFTSVTLHSNSWGRGNLNCTYAIKTQQQIWRTSLFACLESQPCALYQQYIFILYTHTFSYFEKAIKICFVHSKLVRLYNYLPSFRWQPGNYQHVPFYLKGHIKTQNSRNIFEPQDK